MRTRGDEARPFFAFLNNILSQDNPLPTDLLQQFEHIEYFDLSEEVLERRICQQLKAAKAIPGYNIPPSILEQTTLWTHAVYQSYHFYLSVFDYPSSTPNPLSTGHVHDATWLQEHARSYCPFLMGQLLCTASQKLTYDYLSPFLHRLSGDTHVASLVYKTNLDIKNILSNRREEEQALTPQRCLRYALLNLGATIKDLPHLLSAQQNHLAEIKRELATNKQVRNTLKAALTEQAQARYRDIDSLHLLPGLLRSQEDVHALFSLCLTVTKIFSYKSYSLKDDFLDKLIDAEINACCLLQTQIEKLKSRLMDPALPALHTFIQLTTTFHQTTHLNDMSIEMTIQRISNTHKDSALLANLSEQLRPLLDEKNKQAWYSIMLQNAILRSLPDIFKTNPVYEITWQNPCLAIFRSLFDTPQLLDANTFAHNMSRLIELLHARIQELNETNLTHQAPEQWTAPLLSITALLLEYPERVYLYQTTTIQVLTERLHELIRGENFITASIIEAHLKGWITPLSIKETDAVMFEINLFKLLNQYSESIENFCNNVMKRYAGSTTRPLPLLSAKDRRVISNKSYYYTSLSRSLLNEITALKNRCRTQLNNQNLHYQWNHIEQVITRLNTLEHTTRAQSFILSIFKEQLTHHAFNQPVVAFARAPLERAQLFLKHAQPFEAAEQLNDYYRNTAGCQQPKAMQDQAHQLEATTAQQASALLYQTHALLFVTTPLEFFFSPHSHTDSKKSVEFLRNYANKLALFVQQELVHDHHTLISRSKTYARWLRIADYLHAKGDFLGYIAITLGLDNMNVLHTAITCLDQEALYLFVTHVKRHKDSTPTLLSSKTREDRVIIPYPKHFLEHIATLAGTIQKGGTVGFIDKHDLRLYGHGAFHYQIMYRLYQKYHQLILAQLNDTAINLSDWQHHINSIDRLPLHHDSSIKLRTQARAIEGQDAAYRSTAEPRTQEVQNDNIQQRLTADLALYLTEKIYQTRYQSNQASQRNNIFSENRYVAVTRARDAYGCPTGALNIEPAIDTAPPIRLEAFRIGLLVNIQTVTTLFNLLEEERFQSICELDLRNNSTEDCSYRDKQQPLQKLVKGIASYESVILNKNGLDNLDFSCFTEANARDLHIQRLSLQENQLGLGGYGEAGFNLAHFLLKYNKLVSLDINQNYLTERDAAPLATALAQCDVLQEIDLGMNAFGDTGMKLLCKALAALEQLEIIKCFCCKLTDDSVDSIAELINTHQKIIHVIIDGNDRETYRQSAEKLHHSRNETRRDDTYEGMSMSSYVYLVSLLALKQDHILEEAQKHNQLPEEQIQQSGFFHQKSNEPEQINNNTLLNR